MVCIAWPSVVAENLTFLTDGNRADESVCVAAGSAVRCRGRLVSRGAGFWCGADMRCDVLRRDDMILKTLRDPGPRFIFSHDGMIRNEIRYLI